MNVILTGIFYPIAILRYIEQAFRRRDDVNVITVGPYTGTYVPWTRNDITGVQLPAKYATPPDIELPVPYNVFTVPAGFVESLLAERRIVPDVWVQVDAGFHLVGKPARGLNTLVATDPHVFANNHYLAARPYLDIFFNTQTPYMQQRDVWVPYAYDPIWHAPPVQAVEKVFDVVLLGLPYTHRLNLVAALRAEGINVHYDLGPVYAEARDLYHQSRVGINWSSMNDLNARTFELMALGLPSAQNVVPDTAQFFAPGVHFEPFAAVEQAVRAVKYLLDNQAEAAEMAYRAAQAVEPHTWDARVDQILQVIKERI